MCICLCASCLCVYISVCVCVCDRLISEKPPESHMVEVSVVEVYNNEVFDLLAKDGEGVPTGARRDIFTTSTGTSEVPCLTQE